MRGDLTLIMLEIIQAAASTAVEIADALTYYGRDAHYKRLRHIYEKLPERKPLFENQIALLRDRQRVSKLISKLKSEGFVAKNTDNPTVVLTKKGDDKLIKLKNAARPLYTVTESKELKIIVFDVPERKAASRAWLRDALKILKFAMLQKSVWVGNSILPEEFINDLNARGIDKFVEIFAVTKGGTLKQL